MSSNRVTWTPEVDRKMMLWLIAPSAKDLDFGHIAEQIPNATPKAIMERMSKLVRERKALDAASGYTPANKSTTPDGKVTLATLRAASKVKAGKPAKGSGKRKRVQEEDDGESDDGVELKSVEKKEEEEDSAAANDEGDKKKPAEFPMPTSARAKAMSKKLKLAAEKKKTEVKKEGEEDAGVGVPVRGGKSKKNAKVEDTEDKGVVHVSVEDAADEENEYAGYEVVG